MSKKSKEISVRRKPLAGEAIVGRESISCEEIQVLKHEFAERIREYVRSQVKWWVLLPELALEADGKTGYNDTFSGAYSYGMLKLDESRDEFGHYYIWIHLWTGELAGVGKSELGFDEYGELEDYIIGYRLSTDDEIIKMISDSDALQTLDAKKTVKEFLEYARRSEASYMKDKGVEKWRQSKRIEYGLETPDLDAIEKLLK